MSNHDTIHDTTTEIPAGCYACCDAALDSGVPGALLGHSRCHVSEEALAAYRAGYAPSYEDGQWLIPAAPEPQHLRRVMCDAGYALIEEVDSAA